MAKFKRLTVPSVGKDTEQFTHCCLVFKMVQSLWKTIRRFLLKLVTHLIYTNSYNPRYPPPKKNKSMLTKTSHEYLK